MKTGNVTYNYNTTSFQNRSQDDDKRRVSTAEVATTTGTAAAATAVPKAGTWKTFKQFGFDTKNLEKVTHVEKELNGIKTFAGQTATEAKGLWTGLSKNAKHFTKAIIDYSQKAKTNKFIKPLIESKLYKKTAGLIGGTVALFVFISGVGNMTKQVLTCASDKTDKFIKIASGEEFEENKAAA